MKFIVCGLIGLGLAVAGGAPPTTDLLVDVKKEFTDAEAAHKAAAARLGATPSDEKLLDELDRELQSKKQACYAKALALAKADPKSDGGFAALEWLTTYPWTYDGPSGAPAVELLTKHHAVNPKVGPAVATLAYFCPEEPAPAYKAVVALIEAVAETNPDRTARGQAALGRAWQAAGRHYRAEVAADPGAGRLAAITEAELEAVVKAYGDCRALRCWGRTKDVKTIADEARVHLKELKVLGIGKTAPEIEAADLDGVRFKLGDSRGKVVLLVFWASWCGACMADVPHELALAKQFEGRPFVLIGVTGDDTQATAKKTADKHKITWRSFWNGKLGGDGPVAEAWNVQAWPRVFVIDHAGVIRQKHLRGKDLDAPLKHLVELAETAEQLRAQPKK